MLEQKTVCEKNEVKENAVWNQEQQCHQCPCGRCSCHEEQYDGFRWYIDVTDGYHPCYINFCYHCGAELLIENDQPMFIRRD